jgi:hypothetical protein
MKKISTLFKKDPNDLGRVINEVNPGNEWVPEFGIPTRKFDGTACAIFGGILYKRYDVKLFKKKKGKIIKFTKEQVKSKIPEGAIECQKPDVKSGHWPHWIPCKEEKPEDKYHWIAFDSLPKPIDHEYDGTYELCGEKIQGNPEKIQGHTLIPHGCEFLFINGYSFEQIKQYLIDEDIEGIVFHHKGDHFQGRMCKIRKSDFGIKR